MKYAGIGSRRTPMDVLAKLREVAKHLELAGHVCHTGGALGADKAFIDGAPETTVLWLPWQGYNGYYSNTPELRQRHIDFAAKYHPNWKACKFSARKMHGRNAQITLGDNLDEPADFIVCWTPDAKIEGGTGMALRIAIDYDIPVFNLGAKRGADKVIEELYNYIS
ncbi:hypothetical protein [Acinetobacter phage AbTZA1]|uniref:DNA recombination-mediator protein A n=1 Tax=Acinetobacter phage AbTZA1 TaxID=2500827 RepID=A0A3Q9R758_9CAUD|nr:DprA-like DNA recombination-mediator protein [Acinetobacter phage AbTZA1]AZU98629.1 hypothetical protein [Acinetobacter phage AbTZA1]